MVLFRHQTQPFGRKHALKRLQEVQEEIFRQLQLLIPDDVAFHDSLASRVSGSPLLRMEIIERHPYTTFLRLTYEFSEGDDRSYAPDAHIRFYRDAHMAEATSYNTEQGCTRTAHPSYPPPQLLKQAWRRNRALDRWLDYILKQGHSLDTMKPAQKPLGNGSATTGTVKITETG